MVKLLHFGALYLAFAISAMAAKCPAVGLAQAHRIPDWPYAKLVSESDVIVIIEPLEDKPAKDVFASDNQDHPSSDFVARDTRFRVHAILRAKGDTPKELTLLHFAYSATVCLQDAGLVSFLIGPLDYEKRVIKPGARLGGRISPGPVLTFLGQKPTWLAFLRRREDGRFEPVSGQFDANLSFRELHDASFYATP